jgi:Tol biopolymer transport system component
MVRTEYMRIPTLLAAAILSAGLLALAGTESAEAAFPVTAGAIAFSTTRDGNEDFGVQHVYRMNADGFRQTKLTDTWRFNRNPAWSPNGHKIAFQSSQTSNNEIWRMRADGTNQVQLTDDPEFDSGPDWQPLR